MASQTAATPSSQMLETRCIGRGFYPGRRQYALELSMVLPVVSLFDDAAAADLLRDVFACEVGDEPAIDVAEAVDLPERTAALIGRSATLARKLLHTAYVPIIEPETVLSFERRIASEGDRLRMVVPSIETFDERIVTGAYRLAVETMLRWQQPGGDRAALKAAIDGLGETLIGPATAEGNGGASTLPLMREAHARGIPFVHCGQGVYRLGQGVRGRLFEKSGTDGDAALSAKIARNKARTLDWLSRAGLPTPRSILVRSLKQARAAAGEIGWPVVVKPADRERGSAVSVDVEGEPALADAYARARDASRNVLVEERIAGHCHRLVAHAGRFVFGFARLPAAVRGDGASSIRALLEERRVAQKDRASFLKVQETAEDEEAQAFLARSGRTLNDVPAEGEWVTLLPHSRADRWGMNRAMTDELHPDNVALVERAARLLRFESVGLDFITTDPSRPWHETGAAICEVNHQPQIGENTARAYLSGMFGEGDGRIPIHYVVGGGTGAQAEARAQVDRLRETHGGCAFTSEVESIDADGRARPFARDAGLHARMSALIADPATPSLVALVRDDALLRDGLPACNVDAVLRTGEPLVQSGSANGDSDEARDRVLQFLKAVSGDASADRPTD